MGRTIRRFIDGTGMAKSAELGMYVRSSEQGLVLSTYVDDIKMGGNKQNVACGRNC